jgi:hypothetical protein
MIEVSFDLDTPVCIGCGSFYLKEDLEAIAGVRLKAVLEDRIVVLLDPYLVSKKQVLEHLTVLITGHSH